MSSNPTSGGASGPPRITAAELHGPVDRARRHERIFDTLDEGVWERNLVTNVSWYSARFKALLGFAPDELPDDRNIINARVHPEDYPLFLQEYERGIRELSPFRYEVRIMHRSGEYRWMRGRGRVWAGPDGRAALLMGVLSDVHPEKSAIEELQRMTRRFERAVSASNEGLFERVVGSDEMTLSDRFYRLLGHEPGSFPPLRSLLAERVHPEDRAHFESVTADGIRRLGRWSARYRLLCQDGSVRWFAEQGLAARDARGQIVVSGMLADVHEQVLAEQTRTHAQATLEALVRERTARLAETLELARQQTELAQRASQAKSVFLANVSHELRTPLSGVLGMTELALRGATDPDQRRYLRMAADSASALLRIINDLLDVAKIEAGRLKLERHPVDLAELLASTLRAHAPAFRRKPLMARFDFEGPEGVVADAARIQQVVHNLLGNAIKFTARGHVTLVARVAPVDASHARAQIEVSDSGTGIEAEMLQRIFEPFEQGDSSAARRMGGTGLGLSIARQLVAMMDGEITVHSTPGQGSRFVVELPMPLDPAHGDGRHAKGGGRCAWLVSPPVQEPSMMDAAAWVTHRCERLGWRVERVDSFGDVIARLSEDAGCAPACVVLLEAYLRTEPRLDELRAALPAQVRLCALVRSDFNAPALEASAARLGVHVAVTPFTPRALSDLLDGRSSAQAQDEPPLPGPDPGLRGREVLAVEDNPVNQLIIDEMLRALGVHVRVAGGAEQAIAACSARSTDLVLMDLQMPDMDGFEATRRLRRLQADGAIARFPIVALTAHALESDRQACLAAGMDDYLTKPLDLAALHACLRRLLCAEADER